MDNQVKIVCVPDNLDQIELLAAMMATSGFEGVWERDQDLEVWVSETDFKSLDGQAVLDEMKKVIPFQAQITVNDPVNWNAAWEQNFNPIQVGDFCALRADFHPPIAGVEHEVIITPKMSFGTGHHATTYQMIAASEQLEFNGKKVFDYGCGTGLLAILSKKLGASMVAAVDVESWAYENTKENALKNSVVLDEIVCGTLENIQATNTFDIVFANINRNVLLETAGALSQKINHNGQLLLSGFYSHEEEQILGTYQPLGFQKVTSTVKDEWCCLQLLKGAL